MGQQAQIVKKLDNDQYVIELKEKESDGSPRHVRIKFAHDYVEIEGPSDFMIKDSADFRSEVGVSNWIQSRASVQIGIRTFRSVFLPLIMESPFMQDEHFKPREYSEDDKHFERFGLKEPRWKKGDTYPPYAYDASVVHYYDERTKMQMVSFRRSGSEVYETVTAELFKQIRPMLKLNYSKWELQEKTE